MQVKLSLETCEINLSVGEIRDPDAARALAVMAPERAPLRKGRIAGVAFGQGTCVHPPPVGVVDRATAWAFCSAADPYDPRRGVRLVVARLADQMSLTRAERTALWAAVVPKLLLMKVAKPARNGKLPSPGKFATWMRSIYGKELERR